MKVHDSPHTGENEIKSELIANICVENSTLGDTRSDRPDLPAGGAGSLTIDPTRPLLSPIAKCRGSPSAPSRAAARPW
jgi:hypothetical protein